MLWSRPNNPITQSKHFHIDLINARENFNCQSSFSTKQQTVLQSTYKFVAELIGKRHSKAKSKSILISRLLIPLRRYDDPSILLIFFILSTTFRSDFEISLRQTTFFLVARAEDISKIFTVRYMLQFDSNSGRDMKIIGMFNLARAEKKTFYPDRMRCEGQKAWGTFNFRFSLVAKCRKILNIDCAMRGARGDRIVLSWSEAIT